MEKEKVKVILFFMRFFIALAVITLAATTAVFVYPSIYNKVIEINPSLAFLAASLGVLLVTGSIDGLAGITYPAGIQMLLDKSKVKFSILLIIIGLGGYAASGTFSIWARDLVASKIVQKPNDNSMQLYAEETKIFNEGKAAFDESVKMAKVELEKAQAAQDVTYLAKHRNKDVQKQLLAYINNGSTSWASENITGFKTKVRRAKRAKEKQLQDAQSNYNKAVAAQLAYIDKAGATRDMKQAGLKATHNSVINKHESELSNIAGVVWLIDLIILAIIVIGRPIELSYASAYNIEMPRNKSLGFALYRVSLALKNRFIWLLEFITRIDVNGDGVKGKPKEKMPHLEPVKHETAFDSRTAERMIVAAKDELKTDLRKKDDEILRLKKDLEKISLEKSTLDSKKSSKVESSKSKLKPFSPKGTALFKSKVIGIENVVGFANLEKKYRSELLKFQNKILSSKPALESVSKSTRNAFTASLKSANKDTKQKNRVKFLWLSEVLKSNNQLVAVKGGKIKITSK
jgi:hypothetical protein